VRALKEASNRCLENDARGFWKSQPYHNKDWKLVCIDQKRLWPATMLETTLGVT
jgi:hypothetical protein